MLVLVHLEDDRESLLLDEELLDLEEELLLDIDIAKGIIFLENDGKLSKLGDPGAG